MALQTKEGALHFPTWAGPGRMQIAGGVGVSRGASQAGQLPEQKRCCGERPGVFWEDRGVQSNYKTFWKKSRAKWPKDLNTKMRNWDFIIAGDGESTYLLVAERRCIHRVIQEE